MKQLIIKIDEHATLYRDSKTGIAIITDGTAGICHSCHPSIDSSGSVRGMKKKGYWNKNDKVERAFGYQYNTSQFVIEEDNKYDQIVADECNCDSCIERRRKNH